MVFVEGGTFMMGCTSEQGESCKDNEKTCIQRDSEQFPYWQVCNNTKQWISLMEDIPAEYSKGDNYPITIPMIIALPSKNC